MCIKLCADNDFNKDDFFCFGGFAMSGIEQLAKFRNEQPPTHASEPRANGEAGLGDPIPQGRCDLFARRVIAEIGFALFAIVGIIESVVRAVLGLISLLPLGIATLLGVTVKNERGEDMPCVIFSVVLLAVGVTGVVDLPLRCLVAMVKNVCEQKFHFNDLMLCECLDITT